MRNNFTFEKKIHGMEISKHHVTLHALQMITRICLRWQRLTNWYRAVTAGWGLQEQKNYSWNDDKLMGVKDSTLLPVKYCKSAGVPVALTCEFSQQMKLCSNSIKSTVLEHDDDQIVLGWKTNTRGS